MHPTPLLLQGAAFAAILAAAGCASSGSDAKNSEPEPEIAIHELELSSAKPASAMAIPIVVRISVTNHGHVPITVDRIDVSSVGVGPYDIPSTAMDFHRQVEPGHVTTFPMWVRATVTVAEQTISGQESAMMMRAIVFHSTPAGHGRSAVVQRVETSISARD